MTERLSMTCDHCRQLLSDLVCGELNARDEAKARAHVEGCAECAKALAAYQQAIWAAAEVPLDEPSEQLDARIMAAAQAHLEKAKSLTTLSPARIAFGAWLAQAGEWAMSPQVAMASVLLLVVGIGLYALPLGQPNQRTALAPAAEPSAPVTPTESPMATGAAVPTPAQSAEAGERKSAPPRAARSAGSRAEIEARRDRFAPPPPSTGSGGAAAPRRATSSADSREVGLGRSVDRGAPDREKDEALAVAPAAKPRAEVPTTDKAAMPGGAATADDSAREPEKRAGAVAKGATSGELARAATGEVPSDSAAGAGAVHAASGPSAQPSAAAENAAPEPVADAPAAQAPAAAPAAQAPAAPPAPPAPKPNTERADLARAMQVLTAGRLPQAINVLTPLARTGSDEVRDLAQALLAEALHDAGRCTEAVPWFARVITRPTASARSLEMAADCYSKTGRDAKATELRNRARSR